MFQPVNVTIGEEIIAVPTKLNFIALERCKPALDRIVKEMDLVDMTKVGFEVISAALADSRPELTVEELGRRVLVPEMTAICEAITPIMTEAGYWKPTQGEALPAAAPATDPAPVQTSAASQRSLRQPVSSAAT